MNKSKILIVEDDAIISLDIKEKLKYWGYSIVGVLKSGEEAISQFETYKPDLVIMDITLAGQMDGIEAATVIRNRHSTPVVYLTAYSDGQTLSRILQTDSYGYIHKPIDDNILRFTVEMALYKYSMDVKVKESEEKFRMFADSMIDNLWLIDIKTRKYIYSSPSVYNIIGYTDKELQTLRMGQTFTSEARDLITRELEKELVRDNLEGVDPSRSRRFEIQQIHKEGHLVWTEVRAKFMRDKSGTITGILGVTRDITERKQAELLLQYREDFEKLISTTSAEFINLSLDKIDEGINNALAKVARFIDVPSGIVYLYDREREQLVKSHNYHHESHEDRTGSGEVGEISPESFSYYWKVLQRLESIVISRIEDLPPAAHAEHELITRYGFSPLIFVPMIHQGELYGTLGFYANREDARDWSAELIMLLKFVADIFVSALERKRTEEKLIEREERYRTLIEQSPIAIEIYSPDGTLLQVNRAWEKLWISRPEEAVNSFNILNDSQLRELNIVPYFERAAKGESLSLPEYEFDPVKSGFQGRRRLLHSKMYPIKSKDGRILNIILSHEDVTEKKLAEEQAIYYSMYDHLTGLPNKEMFINRIKMEIVKSNRKGVDRIFSVLCLGIDKFKNINDVYGPSIGDALLKRIAIKLQESFRHDDLVSRFDSDKFMVLFSDLSSSDEVMNIVHKTVNVFLDPFIHNGTKFKLTSSIGVSIFPNDGADADTLIKNSESAMYMAKKQGSGTYKLFDHQMHAEIINAIKLETELLSALYYDQFIAFYQPKVNKNGSLTGMETLIRWNSPDRGIVGPYQFIPVAERNGLIVDIGYSILEIACTQNRLWHDAGYHPLRVAVNLSPYQFSQADLIQNIEKILERTGLDPQWLEFEITESGIMKNEKESIERLTSLGKMGVSISIDDFGTGYSSLSKLKSYPINSLKIDKSFIDDIPGDPTSESIVRSIIDLAHNLGYKVIAEGVETEQQLSFLIEHDCDEYQGYYFGKPMPSDDFEKKLSRKH